MSRRFSGAGACLAAAALCLAGPARAQNAEPAFTGTLGLSQLYSDNVLNSDANRQADTATVVSPRIQVRSADSRTLFQANLGLDADVFWTHPDYDAVDKTGALFLSRAFTPRLLGSLACTGLDYEREAPLEQLGSLAGRHRYRVGVADPSLEYRPGAETLLRLGCEAERFDARSPGLPDSVRLEPRAECMRITRRLGEGEVFVRPGESFIALQPQNRYAPLQADSWRVGLSRLHREFSPGGDVDIDTLRLGRDKALGRRLQVKPGLLMQQTRDADGRDVSRPGADLEGIFWIDARTLGGVIFEHKEDVSAFVSKPFEETLGRLSLTRELTSRTRVTLEAMAGEGRYENPASTTTLRKYSVELYHTVSQHLSWTLEYYWAHLDDIEPNQYTKHVIRLSMAYDF